LLDGDIVGSIDGLNVASADEGEDASVGEEVVGPALGISDVGSMVGDAVGFFDGSFVGTAVGIPVGSADGCVVGSLVGFIVGLIE